MNLSSLKLCQKYLVIEKIMIKNNNSKSFLYTIINRKIKKEMINLRDEINQKNFKLKEFILN